MSLRDVVKEVLRTDELIQAVVGFIEYPESEIRRLKVFENVAPKEALAPFIVWQILPGGDPVGHYGDLNALLGKDFQTTAWGRGADEAWQIFGLIKEAFERGREKMEVAATPEYLISIRSQGDEAPLPDQDTGWTQIPSTWRIVLGR